MEFYVLAETYNISGGHQTLGVIPEFLAGDTDGFGPAVSELTLTFHFPHSGPPRKTLEPLYADFHARRRTLPKVVFRRKRGQASIDVASELVDGKDWERDRGLSLPLFGAAVAETIEALALLRTRLTAKDDFDLEGFLAHCRRAQSRLPSTVEELAALAKEGRRRAAARYAALSEWERLGLHWGDFHPDARKILDAPFYWESDNDFAPHGNDTGADLLEDYRRWLRRDPAGDPIQFYRQLIRRWGFPVVPSSDLDRAVMDEAAVALAFAELKLRAGCRPAVAALAQEAIARQREEAIQAVHWPYRDDRLRCLELLQAKLPPEADHTSSGTSTPSP